MSNMSRSNCQTSVPGAQTPADAVPTWRRVALPVFGGAELSRNVSMPPTSSVTSPRAQWATIMKVSKASMKTGSRCRLMPAIGAHDSWRSAVRNVES